jgi:HAD superfamily hydrolase (TIGR01549 family)
MSTLEILGSGKLKERIIDILSIEHPLSASKIYKKLQANYDLSVTYQAVHKTLHEMSQSNILLSKNMEYDVNPEWVKNLHRFTEKIKDSYKSDKIVYGPIKVISFDLDGCLTDNAFDELVWRTEIPKIYAKEHNLTFDQAFAEVTAEYKRLWGKVEGWRDVEFWFKHFGFKTTWQQTIDEVKHHIKKYGDVIPVLEELKNNFKIIIVSHADRKFLDLKMDISGISKYIDSSFSTISDFNEYKKNEYVFKQVCDKLGIGFNELTHIGDSQEYDYNVPKSLGIRSYLIDRVGTEQQSDVVRDLFEFKDKIVNA